MLVRAVELAHVLRLPAVALGSVVAVTVALTSAPVAQEVPPPPAEQVVAAPEPVPTAKPDIPLITPTHVELPSLGVSAPVVPVGVEPDGAMSTPSNAVDVAWWEGVRVGEGNALLAGHKDWNRRPGSFFRLGSLARGDEIVVSGPDGTLTFVVAWVHQMHKNSDAAGILGPQGQPTLTLITCGGRFDRAVRGYEDRIVARAVLSA